MKRFLKLIFCALLMSAAATSLADGRNHSVYSRLYGHTQLAAYGNGFDGYASVDGCGGVTPTQEMGVTVVSKNASVWAEPRTGSKKLGSVEHGKRVGCRLSDDGWNVLHRDGFYAVVYNGQKGWINEDYVVLNELTITLLESNVPAYIAPDAHAKKVGSLSKMTTYRVLGFYDDYYIIALRDAAAYVPMSVRHRDNTFDRNYHGGGGMYKKATTDESVSLRTGPGRDYPEIRKLKPGAQVTVFDVIDDWYMIMDDELNEWAFIAPDSLNVSF